MFTFSFNKPIRIILEFLSIESQLQPPRIPSSITLVSSAAIRKPRTHPIQRFAVQNQHLEIRTEINGISTQFQRQKKYQIWLTNSKKFERRKLKFKSYRAVTSSTVRILPSQEYNPLERSLNHLCVFSSSFLGLSDRYRKSRDSIWKPAHSSSSRAHISTSIQSWNDTINFNSWKFKQLPESTWIPIHPNWSKQNSESHFEFDLDEPIRSNWGACMAFSVRPEPALTIRPPMSNGHFRHEHNGLSPSNTVPTEHEDIQTIRHEALQNEDLQTWWNLFQDSKHEAINATTLEMMPSNMKPSDMKPFKHEALRKRRPPNMKPFKHDETFSRLQTCSHQHDNPQKDAFKHEAIRHEALKTNVKQEALQTWCPTNNLLWSIPIRSANRLSSFSQMNEDCNVHWTLIAAVYPDDLGIQGPIAI